ncbi:MAG: energy transducer TonB [Methylovulum sp.]|nr:energy transducer TonB [Methylovulum sp.]
MLSLITTHPNRSTSVPVQAVIVACLISLILHTGIWQAWQDIVTEPKPEEKPPLIVEVALTKAPSAQPVATPPPAAQPTPPKPVPPAPKPLPPKPEKPKPKMPAKPKPVAKPIEPKKITPTAEPKPQQTQPIEAVKNTPNPAPPKPAPTKQNSASVAPPAPEALVKALYSAPGLKNPPTRYPRLAQMRHLEGVVKLQIHVLANGSAGEIKIVNSSGHPILDESAVEQVKSWHFIPAHKGENTVDDWVRVPISFKFQD